MKKSSLILYVVFISSFSYGQSDSQLTTFAEIYDVNINYNRTLHLNAIEMLEAEEVDLDIYFKLLKLKLEAKDVPQDAALIAAMKKVNDTQSELRKDLLISECRKRNFDYDFYLELAERYQTDLKFNQEASPFILAAKRK